MAATTTKPSPLSSSLSKPTPLPLTHKTPPSFSPKTLPKPAFPLKTSSLSHTHKASSLTLRSKNPISEFFPANKQNPDGDFIDYDDDDKPREECGVVGIYGDPEASRLCYLALHALQHRGQEGAGIVCVQDDVLQSITGVGLVSEVFNQTKLDQLPGDLAIGHVRYSTAGASMLKNVQPFVAGYRFGSVGVAHNGNLVNYRALRAKLEDTGSIFQHQL
ncbi:hypothetical protein Prudu_021750 [Prunus dulcis]|uniref:Glutamine amidotransferase type-2 domain-containing protein n=1 Tax=Prunus dulcis TaxID=3755 RepID=A0A4Y1RZX0_PRUDU|nr:hypothetical protein Prudu_021750 [Prunus dulcis]